ncbi:Na+/H+ antiporter [Nocardiopsis sp. MG754419]|uniref:Na+/H+ antiporter n=1 Tax=Nocardiopsis sp. MG754419 TaxID=2259865 RepID=UPI0024B15155|nr:Na+/H+ antiporter [Nocardiopsis sp. MG754419]MBR8745129.1 Na+/H+ antiporter [Nocardiopsis sp. MG754419]
MLGLVLVVLLGAAILVCTALAARTRVPASIVLLASGVLLGFIPALGEVHLPPELMLLIFLPLLLYWESLSTSLREIRRNLTGIAVMSTVLVIATAGAVAVLGHLWGLPWGTAWVLGAAVAPTDATAVSTVARLLPRRDITALRAEGLVNDGTALVVYGVAVGVTVGEEALSAPHLGWLFLLSYCGGVLAGAATALFWTLVRRRIENTLLQNTAILLIPFTAFLLAESMEASGVLAVVVAGLTMSQTGPTVGRPVARRQTEASWSLVVFLINGSLFVLVGLEVHTALRGLTSLALAQALALVGLVSVLVLAVRCVFVLGPPVLASLLPRRIRPRGGPGLRARVVNAMAGFRGAVSLAVALSVPHTISSGAAFPERDLIVFTTTGVILVTLVVQGLLLPPLIAWAGLSDDGAVEQERRFARETAISEALEALPEVAESLRTDPVVVARLAEEYREHLESLREGRDTREEGPGATREGQYTALRLALLARKRATMIRLRNERRIDDIVLRGMQAVLDTEEVRLTHREQFE